MQTVNFRRSRTSVAFWLGAVVLSTMALNARAEQSLVPHTAEYKVQISVLGGVLQTELRLSDERYTAQHVVKPTGLAKLLAGGSISDASEFELMANGLRPIRFASEDKITRDKTKADIQFDWESGQAKGKVNGQDFVAPINGAMHDRVSIQYALMNDLLNDRMRGEYVLFEVDELKNLLVRSIGVREVKVPAGKFEAIGIQHQESDSDRVTTLWCVEALGFLPVIIEQHRDGKLRFKATLRKYTPLET